MECVFRAIGKCTNLENVFIAVWESNPFSPVGIERLVNHIKNCVNLKHIEFGLKF